MYIFACYTIFFKSIFQNCYNNLYSFNLSNKIKILKNSQYFLFSTELQSNKNFKFSIFHQERIFTSISKNSEFQNIHLFLTIIQACNITVIIKTHAQWPYKF